MKIQLNSFIINLESIRKSLNKKSSIDAGEGTEACSHYAFKSAVNMTIEPEKKGRRGSNIAAGFEWENTDNHSEEVKSFSAFYFTH